MNDRHFVDFQKEALQFQILPFPSLMPYPTVSKLPPTRDTQSQSPEIIPVCEEKLPELEARGNAPRWCVFGFTSNTVRVFVPVAMVYICLLGRKI